MTLEYVQNGAGYPADGSVGHGVHTLCIPASSYGRITPAM